MDLVRYTDNDHMLTVAAVLAVITIVVFLLLIKGDRTNVIINEELTYLGYGRH